MSCIWIPKSHGSPNPNPKITPIPQSSSSISSKINGNKNNKRRNRNRRNKNKNKPNWLELPEDIWFLILSKLYTSVIINNVPKVCKLFRKICIQPSMFRIINMTLPDASLDVIIITRYAVNRSAGQLVDIYLEFCCDDDTLMYIADRSKNLKYLRIGHCTHISKDGFIAAVRKLPILEEVEIIFCRFPKDTYAALGQACHSLKSFSLNGDGCRSYQCSNNEQALAIAKSMPNLRRLQLFGNCMTNQGLEAILNGCPLLESLDLRKCFRIDLSGALGKSCDKIKHLRRPNDSAADYIHRDRGQYDTDDDDHYFYAGVLDNEGFIERDYFDDFDNLSFVNYFRGGAFLGYGTSDSDMDI